MVRVDKASAILPQLLTLMRCRNGSLGSMGVHQLGGDRACEVKLNLSLGAWGGWRRGVCLRFIFMP